MIAGETKYKEIYVMITPFGENLLLKPVKAEAVTAGGLYIPDAVREEPDKGVILAVGNDIKAENLVEGAVVLFRKGVGESVKIKNIEYLILPLKEVIGILKED